MHILPHRATNNVHAKYDLYPVSFREISMNYSNAYGKKLAKFVDHKLSNKFNFLKLLKITLIVNNKHLIYASQAIIIKYH